MTTNVKEENGIIEATYDSSNIASSKFEKETNTLYITFVKGNLLYKYENVDPSDYYYLQYAESTGKAFIDKIKNKYLGQRV
jgi:hypothetical protein